MRDFPKIVKPVFPEFLEDAKMMEGKTIKKIEYGHREHVKNVHESEVLILEFTDQTKLGITIGSNALELKGRKVKPEDFKADFMLIWNDE